MADKNLEIRALTSAEWGPHEPPDGDERWQESWGFSWHDPIRRAGGINHVSIWRNRGVADVWSWVALDGKVVGKYQSLNLPVPDEDFPNWSAGGQNITTIDGRSCRMFNTYENAQVDIGFAAFTDPLAFPVDAEGNTWGASHYEMMGRVDGTVTVGGVATTVSGMGWQDHSWGPRRWADTMSHRWIMAIFGPDLFFTVLSLITESSPTPVPIGIVYDHGELYRVESATFGTRMHEDGHSPAGCDAHLWTDSGRGYHITGEVHTSSPSSHVEGFWFTDGLCTYECGGRLGAGILEVQELNRPAPWTARALGLDLPDAMPAYAGA